MKIAVTGGNGRVGTAVIGKALRQEHTVVSIDRTQIEDDLKQPAVEYVEADLTNYHAFAEAISGCDALIHLAAIPSPLQFPDHEVHNNNVVASYNALSAAAHSGIKRICQASSINAIGALFSRWPQYDYFPLDEMHPTYNEDAYSLSKWICEQQADAIARRHESISIASLRIHWVVDDRAVAYRTDIGDEAAAKNLWGYVRADAVARACLLSLTADFTGHEVFFIVAPDTFMDTSSMELKEKYFSDTPLRHEMIGNQGFFNCSKAERLLRWQHDQ